MNLWPGRFCEILMNKRGFPYLWLVELLLKQNSHLAPSLQFHIDTPLWEVPSLQVSEPCWDFVGANQLSPRLCQLSTCLSKVVLRSPPIPFFLALKVHVCIQSALIHFWGGLLSLARCHKISRKGFLTLEMAALWSVTAASNGRRKKMELPSRLHWDQLQSPLSLFPFVLSA